MHDVLLRVRLQPAQSLSVDTMSFVGAFLAGNQTPSWLTALRYMVTRFRGSQDFTVGAFQSIVRERSAY